MSTRSDDDATIGPMTAATPPSGGFTPGAIIAGRYRLVALLGRGGMGEVYRAAGPAELGPWWITAAFQLVIVAGVTVLVVRYGLLVTVVAIGIINVIGSMPLTLSLSHWTATTSNLVIATVIGIAAFGFYASRAGQPLFGNAELKT